MTRDEIDRIVAQYTATTFDQIEDCLALEWEEPGLDEHRWALNDRAHLLAAGLAQTNLEATLGLAREMVPAAAEEVQRKLARRLMEVQLQAIKAELLALSGEPMERPSLPQLPSPLPTVVLPAALTVSEVVLRYVEERVARKNWTDRSATQYKEIFAVIVDLLGDSDVASVTKDDMRALGLALTRFPSNAKKVFPGLTPAKALVRAGEDQNVARLSSSSVDMYQQAARSLFKWAAEHDYVVHNPASVLRDLKTGRAKDDRKPFDDQDLRLYFAALGKDQVHPFMFWIPRILAYSGCRLGEAAQLRKSDIRQQEGVWYFDINEEGEGKRLKTSSSTRQVPMHPRLIDLGFLEFVGKSGDEYLWPSDMRTNSHPDRSPIDKLQKRLAHQMTRAGVDRYKKTAAHSFRHTVADRLARGGAHEADIAWILGHEQVTITTKRYGAQPPVWKLYNVLSVLELPI